MPAPDRTPGMFRFGAFEADPRSGELRKHGMKIKLQDQPFQILTMLLERSGQIVTREELRLKLWPGDTFVDFDHGLNNAINRLREALNDSADTPRFIETLPRRGYRFVGPVEHAAAAGDVPVVRSAQPGRSTESILIERPTADSATTASRSRGPRKFWVAAAGLGVAGALLLGLELGRRNSRVPGSGAAQIQSIAVLPLENVSGDPAQEYFVDGITDALTTYLAQMRGIRVISRTSAMLYKGTKKTPPQIARELRVDAVVKGSASRSDNVIHVNAQLLYAPGDRRLWADSYDVSAVNLPNLQAEIAGAVAKEIGAAIPPAISVAHSVNPEAYDLYLRAKLYYGVQTPEATGEAMRLLERSVAIDPEFAAAYAALATTYRDRGFGVEPEKTDEWVEKAGAAVQKALSLDPNLAETYVSRGYLLWSRANNWAVERAVGDYRHALSLNPNLAEAYHQLANVYNHVGLLDKAQSEIQRAVELDPLNPGIRFRVGINLFYQGKYEDSLAAIRDSQKFNPPFWVFQTSVALQHLRRLDEAQKRVAVILEEKPDDRGGSLTAMQALLAADVGDARKAEVKIREALEKGKGYQHFHHVTYAVASSYALLNKPEQALRYLQMTADDGFPCYPLFERDANLNKLRQNPKFIEFMAAQKKQWEYFKAKL